MDLNPDGTISIKFTDGDTTTNVTVNPPKVGGYRRLRKELYAIDGKQAAFVSGLPEGTSEADSRNEQSVFHEDALLDWWRLVLLGDDSFKALTSDAVPQDADAWPVELATNAAALAALSHFISAPLNFMSGQGAATTA